MATILMLQRMLLEFILDFIWFPLWWYSVGAKRALFFCFNLLSDGNSLLAPGLWLKNIFVPMFGQTDWQGRLVSFIVRLGNVIGRFIAMIAWLALCVFVFSLWFLFPIFVAYMLVNSF